MRTVRPYQSAGAAFLASRPGAILGDAVGLGKTLEAIDAAYTVGGKDILVICPLNLKGWWGQEIASASEEMFGADQVETDDFLPRTPQVLVSRNGWRSGACRWTLAHYEQFINSSAVRDEFLERRWDVVIVDEAHKIKNRKAQRTRGIWKLDTGYHWGLTGRPVAERPPDLWGLMHWAAPREFPSFWRFVEEFTAWRPGGDPYAMRYAMDTVRNLPHLAELVKPYLLVRSREDVGLELPPLTVTDVPVPMEPAQEKFYKRVKKEVLVSLSQEQDLRAWDLSSPLNALIITSAIARFTRLHQVASAPTTFMDSLPNGKMTWLQDYLEGGGAPAVIMSRYLHTVAKIKEIVPDDFMVGTYSSLSHGHNLQFLNVFIAWDMTYSSLEWDQAVGRVYRMGQERPVQVYRLQAEGTVDKRVADSVDRKEAANEMIYEWLRGVKTCQMV